MKILDINFNLHNVSLRFLYQDLHTNSIPRFVSKPNHLIKCTCKYIKVSEGFKYRTYINKNQGRILRDSMKFAVHVFKVDSCGAMSHSYGMNACAQSLASHFHYEKTSICM